MSSRFGVCTIAFSLAVAFGQTERVADGVTVIRGAVNGVRFTLDGKPAAIYGDPRAHPPAAALVFFTHHRRDVVWAGRELVRNGAEAIVPQAELALFEKVDAFWQRFETARLHDYSQQSSKLLAAPFPKATAAASGAGIEVLDTPGYTRGAVSYLLVAGGKRIACTGDLIYGDGRILDLYSLQDAIPETKEDGYHGYGARAADVIASLRKVAAWKPDVIVPARGPVITDPRAAIGNLTRRLQAVFASHYAIDALRWYRGDEKLKMQAARILGPAAVEWMPQAEVAKPELPDWIAATGNSRLILSKSGRAFLIDCGNQKILADVLRLRQEGRFRTLDGIFVTHYHDDHTNFVQTAAEEFRCPVFATEKSRDILENPARYRMPAQTGNPIRGIAVVKEGERRRWNEFEFEYFHFPGQTLYHDGLLVRKDGGETVFFAGDSFTPTGIDDYCLLNRNFMDPEPGFLSCLNRMKQWKPGYLVVNEHVAPAFRFTPAQIDVMIENLRKRAGLMRELFPWDGANYGLDEQWARFYPYGIEAQAGRPLEMEFVIWNHSPATRTYRVTPRAPEGWRCPSALSLSVPAHAERSLKLRITPPAGDSGLRVITADVAFGDWDLREWAEALVRVR